MKAMFYLVLITFSPLQSTVPTSECDSSSIQNIESLNKKVDSLKTEIRNLRTDTYGLQQITKEKNLSLTDIFIGKWIPILSFFIALISIAFGLRAIRHSRNMKIFQLLNDLINKYETEEMLDSILTLIDWKKKHEKKDEDFAREFAKLRRKKYSEVKELDVHRRRVSFYFGRLFKLWENRIISKKDIHGLVSSEQIDIYLDYVSPLEAAMSPKGDRSVFNFFKELNEEQD